MIIWGILGLWTGRMRCLVVCWKRSCLKFIGNWRGIISSLLCTLLHGFWLCIVSVFLLKSFIDFSNVFWCRVILLFFSWLWRWWNWRRSNFYQTRCSRTCYLLTIWVFMTPFLMMSSWILYFRLSWRCRRFLRLKRSILLRIRGRWRNWKSLFRRSIVRRWVSLG